MNYGFALDIRWSADTTLQLLYNRQETHVDIRVNDVFETTRFDEALAVDYYHLGGSVEFSSKRLRPYFALTMGATRFDLALPDISDEWRFSIGVGGGFKAYVSDRVGVRADGRMWPTFVNTAGGFFCSASTGCLVSIRSDFFVQGNATVGLFFGF